MLLLEILHIINHQYQIAAATRTRHLPGMNLRQGRILIYKSLHTTLNHGWEHGHLCIKRSLEGRCKGRKILARIAFQQSSAALARAFTFTSCNILAFYHRTARRRAPSESCRHGSPPKSTSSSLQVSNLSGQKRLS